MTLLGTWVGACRTSAWNRLLCDAFVTPSFSSFTLYSDATFPVRPFMITLFNYHLFPWHGPWHPALLYFLSQSLILLFHIFPIEYFKLFFMSAGSQSNPGHRGSSVAVCWMTAWRTISSQLWLSWSCGLDGSLLCGCPVYVGYLAVPLVYTHQEGHQQQHSHSCNNYKWPRHCPVSPEEESGGIIFGENHTFCSQIKESRDCILLEYVMSST